MTPVWRYMKPSPTSCRFPVTTFYRCLEMADQSLTVELRVNGKSFSGWKSVDIERGIEQIAGSFEVSVSEFAPNGDAASNLHDGSKVSVRVNGEDVITGFIDEMEIAHSATQHSLTLRGRDATADLVDCSAMHPSNEWVNIRMLDVVKDLVKDYKIPVKVTTNLGEPFEKWSIEKGESIFENIDKLARFRNVMLMSDGLGGLLLTQPGTETIDTALILGKNILSGRLTRSMQQRFSNYYVYGQRQRNDNYDMDASSQPYGKATDTVVPRHRDFVCCYEDANASIKSLTDRATWQSRVNAARAQVAKITVQGWTHAKGLWQPNKQVIVTDSLLRLENSTMLISNVHFTLDNQGSRTELTLAPRNAFLVDQLPQEIADDY